MIKLEHISKTFGGPDSGVHAVRDVSLEIEDGEIFGIIGFSGAGKSTLVRCINLLERPTSGTVTVDGQELTSLSERELRQARKKISMIFQSFNLLMQRTCLKNVCFPMELSGVPRVQAEKKAQELLELVGLKEKANAYPSQLSGGQMQRVAIARALMRHPALLLADEPVASLDPVTGRQILELLRDIQQDQKLTVLMNSHNLELSQEFSSRLIGLNQGTVVLDAPADTPAKEILAAVYHRQEDQP